MADLQDAMRELDYRTGPIDNTGLPAIDLADVSRWNGLEPAPIEFVFQDLTPRGMVTLLPADGGAGKSLLQQAMLSAVAGGISYLGRQITPAAAAGVFAEDPDNVLHLRQARINAKFGLDYDQLAGRLFVQSVSGRDAALWNDERPTPYMAELEAGLSRIPDLALVTLDNGALLYHGDESDRNNVTAFLNRLNGMAERLRVAIVLSVHTSKSSDENSRNVASGSTAWINAARSVLLLKAAEKGEPPLLRLTKSNHARPGAEVTLRWDGAVLVAEEQATGIDASIEKGNREKAVIAAIQEARAKGQAMSETPNQPNHIFRVFQSLGLCRNVQRRDLENILIKLKAAGAITYGETGNKTAGKRPELSYIVVPEAGQP